VAASLRPVDPLDASLKSPLAAPLVLPLGAPDAPLAAGPPLAAPLALASSIDAPLSPASPLEVPLALPADVPPAPLAAAVLPVDDDAEGDCADPHPWRAAATATKPPQARAFTRALG